MGAAPVCRAALAEATRLWPNRNRASDGICADANHASSSDHNDPDRDGFCEAFDLTHDPANGCDAHALVRAAVARRDPRIKYAISQGRIWSAARAGEGWRVYTGSNKHDKHAHVSTADAYRDDTSSWWKFATPSPLPATPTPTTTAFPGDHMRRIDHSSPLDDQGNGYVDIAGVAKDRIVGFVANGDDPSGPAGDVGYKPIPKFAPMAWGTGSRVVIEEGPPRGRIDFSIWVVD